MAGQKYGEIEYSVGFSIDNQSLQTLKKSLQEISTMTVEQYQKANFNTSQNKTLEQSRKELIEIQKEVTLVQNALEKAFNTNLGTTNITKFSQSLKGVDLSKLYKDLTSLGPAGTTAFRSLATGLTTMNIQAKESHKLLDKMATSLKNTIQWGISSSVYNTLASSLQKAWSYAKNLDSALNDIRIVSGQSAEQMEKFAIQANRAAQSLGASTLDFAKASLIYFQQGLSTQEANERAEVTIKMANVLGASAQEVSSYMTAIWNNFDTGSKSLEYFADVITALGASTASSSEEIATGLEKFAAVANTVGLSYEYATAALATVVAQTRQSADTVGTAFKTIFARIQDLELGKTLEDGTALGTYAEALQKVGINIKDQYGQLKKMDTILDEMGAKWQTLSQAQKVALAENVAGTRQYTQLIALLDNWDNVKTNINTASNSIGNLQKQQDIYLESTEAHLTQLSTATERLMSSFIDNKGINSLVDSLTNVVKLVANFVEGIGGGGNALLMLGSIGTQVFSNQIATGLTTTIRNLQKTKQAALDAETAINNLKLLNDNKDIQQDPVWKELKGVIADFQSIVTKMDQDSINQITQWINELESLLDQKAQEEKALNDAVDYIKSIQNIDNETDLSEDQAIQAAADAQKRLTENIKGSVDEQKKLVGGYEQYLALVEQAQKNMQEDYDTKDKQWGAISRQQNKDGSEAANKYDVMMKDIKEIRKHMLEVAKEAENFANNMSGALTEEEKNKILKRVEDLRAQLSLKDKKYIYRTKGSKGAPRNSFNKNITTGFYDPLVKDLKDATTKAQQQINKATDTIVENADKKTTAAKKKLDQNINDTTEKIKGAVEVSKQTINVEQWVKLASAVGQLGTSVHSFINIWNVFKNDSLSAGEKIIQIISSLGTSVAMFGNSMKLIKDNIGVIGDTAKKIAVNYYIEKAAIVASNEAKKQAIVDNTVLQASQGALSTANITTAATFKGLALSIGQTLLAMAPYLAVAAAIGAVGYLIYEAATKDEQEYKSLKKAQEDLANSVTELSESITGLKDSWDSLKNAENVLDGCITYSTEWKEQLIKVNEQVEEILKKYPDLLNIEGIVQNTNGRLSLDETKFNNYLLNKEQTLIATKKAQYIADLAVLNKDRKRALFKDLPSIFGEDSLVQAVTRLSEQDQRALGQKGLSKQEYDQLVTETLQNYIKASGQDEKDVNHYVLTQVENTLKNSQSTFQDIATTLDSIDIKVDNIKKVLVPEKVQETGSYASQLWEDQSNLDDLVNKILEAESWGVFKSSEEFDEDAQAFMRMYQISQGQTFDQAKFTNVDYGDANRQYEYDGKRITRQQMAASIVAYLAQGNKFNPSDIYGVDTSEGTKNNYNEALNDIYEKVPSQENIVKQANEAIQKVSEKYNISSELADKLLSRDVNNLTPEDIEKINKILKADDNLEQGLKDLGIKIVESDKIPTIKEFLDSVKSGKYEAKAKQNKESKIESIYKGGAEATSETVAGLKYSAQQLKAAAKKKGNILSEQDAAQYAVNLAKFSKSMDAVNESLAKNKDLLKKWKAAGKDYSKISREMRLAAEDFQSSIKEQFGVEIPLDTIRDKFNVIQKALQGDKKALVEFQHILADAQIDAKNFTWNIGISDEQKNKTLDDFHSLMDQLIDDGKNADIGVEIWADDSKAIQTFNELIEKSGWTEEQVNDYLSKIGFEGEIETYSKEIELETVPAQTITLPFTNKTITIPAQKTKQTVQVPIIKSVKKGSSFSNYKPSSTKSSGGGKKGSGSSSNTKKDKIDDEFDRYHEINTQITKTSNLLKKLESQQNKLTGAKLIKNLTEQWKLLNTQVSNFNTKLGIAKDEQQELHDKLAKKGFTFNADGTISNYMSALETAEANYNKKVDQYNKLSSKNKKKWDENKTLDKAKEEYENIKKWADRYDTVISSEIPQLQQDIQDALDKQIEINVQKFNLKLKITLDMNQATRDWNDWKKKIIDGIRDDDILGNAKAKLQDFYTYYSEDGRGDIQSQTRQVNSILAELKQMDETGWSDIYHDDRQQALDELNEKYTALMKSMTDAKEIQKELHQAVLEQIDASQEAFDKQVANYTLLNDLIEHDKKVVQLVYGDKTYADLEKFYKRQQQNYNQVLDFQKREKDFWQTQMLADREKVNILKTQLDTLTEGTEEWVRVHDRYKDAEEELEKVTDKWKTSVENFNKTLEESLTNAREKFENTINAIFDELNNKVTNGMGLEYVNEQWELINKNADRYLDTINKTYGIRQLEKKYVDAIDKTNNIKVQQKLKTIMDEQLTNLKERDRLTQYELDRANKLYDIEVAKIALQEAQMNKSQMRLRRDTQGNYTYQYVANDEKIREAEEKLQELYNQLYNFDKERYNAILNDAYSAWNDYQQKLKEAETTYANDLEELEKHKLLLKEQYEELITQIEQDYQIARYNLQSSAFTELEILTKDSLKSIASAYGLVAADLEDQTQLSMEEIKENIRYAFNGIENISEETLRKVAENFSELTNVEKETLLNEMIPTWENGISQMVQYFIYGDSNNGGMKAIEDTFNGVIYSMKTLFAGDDGTQGFVKAMTDGWGQIEDAENEYVQDLANIETQSGLTFDSLRAGYNEVIPLAEHLVEENTSLISKYADEILNIQLVEDEVQKLIDKYAEAKQAADEATTAAYNYEHNNYENDINDIEEIEQGGGQEEPPTENNEPVAEEQPATPVTTTTTTTASKQSNGVVDVGDKVTINSSYAASVGGNYIKYPMYKKGSKLYIQKKYNSDWVHIGTTPRFGEGNVGWIRIKDISGYDTGGYTGTWNNSGRLAMLHQKELVLNARDTENMLNTVAIMRNLAYSLGSNTLARLANATAAGYNNSNENNGILEQNVHIDATFPNVKDAREIEEALNNLVNVASQRVMEK